MHFKTLASVFLTALATLASSHADCSDGSCGPSDSFNLRFTGSGKCDASSSSDTTTVTMTMKETTVTSTTVSGPAMATTSEGSIEIKPETIYDGNVTLVSTGVTGCASYLSGYFTIDGGCGLVVQSRSKPHAATSYSEWKETSGCTARWNRAAAAPPRSSISRSGP